jgi:hypothetical protein
VFLVAQTRIHNQSQDLDARRGPYLLPFDAYRFVRGLAAVPGKVDEGSLIPFERRPTPALPLGRSLHYSLETIHVLCYSLAHNLRGVVVNKSDRTAVLVDSLLNKVGVKE